MLGAPWAVPTVKGPSDLRENPMTDDPRDDALARLATLMGSARPEVRDVFGEMARAPFEADEIATRRREFVRFVRRSCFRGLSDLQTAKCIAKAVEKRTGTEVRSTGSLTTDENIDQLIMIAPNISVRSIRRFLSSKQLA